MSAPAAHREQTEHKSTSDEPERSSRARRIIQREVSFIYSAEFEQRSAERRILEHSTSQVTSRRRKNAPSDVPGHLRHLWEIPLLSSDEETDLFRRMNFLKYRSNALRSRLNPARPNVRHMDDIERMLSEATDVRNHIVQANTRLVVSIARRFKNVADAFDEMISTGNLILVKAVERFDYSRGFRFSTYATHSVQREFYRYCGKKWNRQATEVSMGPESLLDSIEDRIDGKRYEEADLKVDYVRSVMARVLPGREQRVVIARFGLDSDSPAQTLREIGEEMGLSKERVRQLQLRALDRLHSFVLDDVPESGIDAT